VRKNIIIITSIFLSILAIAVFLFVDGNNTQKKEKNNISINYQEFVNKKLPDITVYSKENKEISIKSISSGKPVFMMYWASWCPDCQKQLPIIKKLYDEYKDKIEFILINIADGERETQDKALSYLKDKEYNFNYYSATENAIDLLKINTIPTKVIVSKDGIVKNIHIEEFSSYEKLKKSFNTEIIMKYIAEKTKDKNFLILTGVGKVFPIVRTHTILNNLQNIFDHTKVLLFFPGEYTSTDLRLFGFQDNNYYRAFKI